MQNARQICRAFVFVRARESKLVAKTPIHRSARGEVKGAPARFTLRVSARQSDVFEFVIGELQQRPSFTPDASSHGEP